MSPNENAPADTRALPTVAAEQLASSVGGYADVFTAYRAAGWRSTLPLPPRAKTPPPAGYTGRDAAEPSYPDCYGWAEEFPDGNVCLRLPPGVIGVDVDHYGDKSGGDTLDALEAVHGPLPATWRTGSRTDGVSGIRLYRVPVGLRWPGVLGPGIEVIQDRHRYAVVWPSIHPATGSTYQWSHEELPLPDGGVPRVDDLAELPAAWVDGVSLGAATTTEVADLDDPAVAVWLVSRGQGSPCHAVERGTASGCRAVEAGGSRHDAANTAVMHLARLAAEGHPGTTSALQRVRDVFGAVADDRTPEALAAEWDRLVVGAVRIAAASDQGDYDPCEWQLEGIVERTPAAVAQVAEALAVPLPPLPSVGGPDATQEDTQLSWEPLNLEAILDGTAPPLEPTLMRRTDGAFLLYPGMVHSLNGEPESGKSMIAHAEAARILADGQRVMFVDFESDEATVCGRLIALGATRQQILDGLDYLRPQVPPSALVVEGAAWERRLGTRYDLVVLDGVTEAFSVYGVASLDNDEVTRWIRRVPKALAARTGAAVVLIDHVVKNAEAQGRFAIGAQAKLAGLTGASYMVEVLEPIGRGMAGRLALRIGKDRPGMVRPRAGAYRKGDRSQEAAVAVIDSRQPGRILYRLEPPRSVVGVEYVPHELMEKVSRYIEESGTSPGFNRINQDVPGKKENVREAIDRLVSGGYVRVDHGPNKQQFHAVLKPYRRDSLTGLLSGE